MVTAEHREHLRQAGLVSTRVRQERARTRSWLREPADTWEARDRLADLLLGDPLAHLATVEIGTLLTWCRGVRLTRSLQILRRLGIRESRLVGQLTLRQAMAIAGELRQGVGELQLLGAS